MQLDISTEVADALAGGVPVIALETTVITHGMAFPHNVETALAMEDAIRAERGCPATLGIVNGRVVVGEWIARQNINDSFLVVMTPPGA